MLTEAVRLPGAPGVNVTLAVHIASGATEFPHVLVTEKSPAFVPDTTMLVMVKVAVPVLVRLTVCAALVVPTDWLVKVTLRLLIEMPAMEMDALPEQEADKRARTTQAAARIATIARRGCDGFLFI